MNRPRPLIGLNTSIDQANKAPLGLLTVPLAYVDSIVRAGGLPVLLPPYEDAELLPPVLERLDGFCFIGGPDYHPHHYGGREQKTEELMEARRDRFDLALAELVLKESNLPVLGVCGGHQLLNIAMGGALVQDLRTEWLGNAPKEPLPHAGGEREEGVRQAYRHAVRVEPGSLLARVTMAQAGELLTNSFHHQAVNPQRIGAGLRATAWAPDGVIEALEASPDSTVSRDGRFFLGVQWHPERMPDEAAQRSIFSALVEAAGKKR